MATRGSRRGCSTTFRSRGARSAAVRNCRPAGDLDQFHAPPGIARASRRRSPGRLSISAGSSCVSARGLTGAALANTSASASRKVGLVDRGGASPAGGRSASASADPGGSTFHLIHALAVPARAPGSVRTPHPAAAAARHVAPVPTRPARCSPAPRGAPSARPDRAAGSGRGCSSPAGCRPALPSRASASFTVQNVTGRRAVAALLALRRTAAR